MKKITICDTAIINGEEQVLDQQDYNIPFMFFTDIDNLCEFSECDSDCNNCIINLLMKTQNNSL